MKTLILILAMLLTATVGTDAMALYIPELPGNTAPQFEYAPAQPVQMPDYSYHPTPTPQTPEYGGTYIPRPSQYPDKPIGGIFDNGSQINKW